MKIEFDPAKSEKNLRERGLSFDLLEQFDWESAIYWQDNGFIYAEVRFTAIGYVGKRLHVVCFAPRMQALRIISFRKANAREVRRYEKEKAAH